MRTTKLKRNFRYLFLEIILKRFLCGYVRNEEARLKFLSGGPVYNIYISDARKSVGRQLQVVHCGILLYTRRNTHGYV